MFELVDQEIERLRRRGEATEAVERAMRHLAGVLVHTPSARARQLAAAGEAERFAEAIETAATASRRRPPGSRPPGRELAG